MTILAQLEAIQALGTAMQKPLPECSCGGACFWCRPWHQSNLSPPAPVVGGNTTGLPVAGFLSTDRSKAA